MASHTPGPWAVISGTSCVIAGTVQSRDNWQSTIVAITHQDGKPLAESRANAALVAAAPDLLAICEEISSDPRIDLIGSERRIRLYAAIEKALKPNVRTP